MKVIWKIIILCLFLNGLPAQQVRRDYDRAVDFKAFRSYAWIEYEKPPVYRVSKEDNPEISDEQIDGIIRSEIDKILEKKGFRKAAQEQASFFLSYMAMARYDLGVEQYDPGASGAPRLDYGHWRPFYEPGQDTRLLKRGTLTIDIVDAGSKKLAWRGTVTNSVSTDRYEPGRLSKAIKKVLDKFPPR